MEIYNKLSQPPKSALREIKAGDLKGKTDINPQWRYKAMTEIFGMVGTGWKYEIQKLWTEPGAKTEVLAFAQVAVFVKDPNTQVWSDPIIGIGGSKLINNFSTGLKSNDEGYKMAVTDAFSTSLKMLGVAAAIYEGKWDGSKYVEIATTQNVEKTPQTPQKQQKQQKQQTITQLKGGPDTPDQTKIINELLKTEINGFKVFSSEEIKQVASWRLEYTADEVIATLSEEVAKRTAIQPEVPNEIF